MWKYFLKYLPSICIWYYNFPFPIMRFFAKIERRLNSTLSLKKIRDCEPSSKESYFRKQQDVLKRWENESEVPQLLEHIKNTYQVMITFGDDGRLMKYYQ